METEREKVDVIRSCFSPEWEHVVHQIPIKSRKSESMCSGSYQVKEVMREFSAMGPMQWELELRIAFSVIG